MKQLVGFLLIVLWLTVHSQDAVATNNAIKMGYNFVTVSQIVVFNSTMQAGGTFTLSAQAMDGGGRAPGDPFVIKMVFYNSSNQITNTAQLSSTLVYGATTPATYTTTTTNCGGSCANVAYVSVQFYGKDGGYWAGNYGPYIINPSLSFNGGPNILYNPEFGVYGTNGYAQGWTSSNGWQSCALYSGAQTCVINNGAPVNAAGGGYSASGGTTSSPAGGQSAAPPEPPPPPALCCGGSSAAFSANSTNVANVTAFTNRAIKNSQVYIDQIGDDNTILVSQQGTKENKVVYQGNGSNNTVTINQNGNNATVANYIDLKITGDSNTANLTQTSTGGGKGIFATINNNNNSLIVQQKDSGSHYVEVTVSGGNKNVDVLQQGSGNHMTKIDLSGNPVNLNLIQGGSTQQFYSIQHTCATAGGCAAITVTQGQ
jgi:hypothetical protein